MKRSLIVFLLLNSLTFCPPAIAAPDTNDTRLLAQPAAGPEQLAFVYADDLWIADYDGSNLRRLTTHIGFEGQPVISPDGDWVAFSGEYDGNIDVYLISSKGGIPKRLTYHPGDDLVRDFTPDGSGVLFSSAREVFTRRYTQFFTVPVGGGMPEKLPIPNGVKGCYSPDGKRFAYTPLAERFKQWKNYRGGTHTRIWILTFAGLGVEQIPQPEGRCNDSDPFWLTPNKLLFRSDREGEFNLYSFDLASKEMIQLTRYNEFPVLDVSVGGGHIVYEQGGYLHHMTVADDGELGQPSRLKIGVAADLPERRARYVKGSKYVRSASVSPSGARAVVETRGEIITVPAEKGDPRNLCLTQDAHERSPSWSPDGETIAYVSDRSGEYQLILEPQSGKGEERIIPLMGAGFYRNLVWSPDSKKLLYQDNASSIYCLDVGTGKVTPILDKPAYGGSRSLGASSWSPDSRWVAYSEETPAQISRVHVYSLEAKKSYPLTDGLSEAVNPVFDRGGKYLYFLGSTDTGMNKHGFSQSSGEVRTPEWSLYLAVLQADEPSPFRPESDEEESEDDDDEKEVDKEEDDDENAEDKEKSDEKKPDPVSIDFDGIDQRIVAFPLSADSYLALQSGKKGQLFFLKRDRSEGGPGQGGATLMRYDLKDRKATEIKSKVRGYELTPDASKVLYSSGSSDWFIAPVGKGAPEPKKLDLAAIEIKIDPVKEWPQIFHEAWRINRDYFYATNFHGADWEAMREKYRPFVDHCATRSDLNRVIQWMCSELAVGHHRGGGGDRLHDTDTISGGLLGADYEVAEGRYRFKKVYGGLNWDPNLRAPLTEPGVNVKAGEYLLAVRGQPVRPPENLYQFFENTAGEQIEITVGPDATGKESRTVIVRPIGSELSLRNRAWIEGNLKKVHEATDGKVAYVYVPDTAGRGREYFKRYFFPQVDKQAVIIDERFNSGGQVADYYIDLLRRPFLTYWVPRYGANWRTPSAAIHGPKVMIINETAGSGGDLLPWMFRRLKMGTLVGKRTWGGLVGISGYPSLIDGGSITAPSFAIWDPENGWVVENAGVPPDVEVEQYPADIMAGRDPQLEKAIEIVLEQLEKSTVQEPKRPPFPVRALPGAIKGTGGE